MGKSYRKTNVIGNCSHSEKHDKRLANRSFRKKFKTQIFNDIIIDKKEASETWSFSKDGKHYFGTYKEFMNDIKDRIDSERDEDYWKKVWRKMKNK